jgi:hypothetical protein
MAGIWTSQDKVLPGAYLNFKTNSALSITPGERGTVVILQELSAGVQDTIYEITATDASEWPAGVTDADKFLAGEALKNAKTVLIYNLGATAHDATDLATALAAIETVQFNVLCYPYDTALNHATIKTWVEAMIEDEGISIQAVLPDYVGDYEGIINVDQAVVLSDNTELTKAQTTAWVAGATAGATIYQSNTGKVYEGAIDVTPRMTKTEMAAAVTAGGFIFKVDSAQNVSVVYDINSLTTLTATKGKQFQKNRAIRTINGINNDITKIFEANYIGKINNNADGRSLLKSALVGYFVELQRLGAIQNFEPDDVVITAGTDSDAVVIDCYVQLVDSAEKIYISVNLS